MAFVSSNTSYDGESLRVLQSAFDLACNALGIGASSPSGTRETLAKHILGVAASGESEMGNIAEHAIALMLEGEG